jgi:hypothetical protein
MLSRPFAALSALGLALAGAGCGRLSGDTGSPSTLTNIHGTVTSDSASTPPASLATAIVWFGMSADHSFHESADSVPVSGGFPASFGIALTDIPPASAMVDFSTVFADSPDVGATGVHVALGFVVAYDDLNGNGRLDIVDPGASQYVDRVEGVADRIIFYLDQSVPDSLVTSPQFTALGIDGSKPQKGYNLAHPDFNYCFAAADAGAGSAGACVRGYMWEPMDTPVSLTLGKGPVIAPQDLQQLMCSTGPNGNTTFTSTTLPPTISVADFSGALPSADDENVLCDDLHDFQYTSSCTTSPTAPCQQVNTVCTQQTIVTLDPVGGSPIAPPAGWPCAAQPPPSPVFLSWLAAGQHSSSGGGGGSSGSGAGDAGLSSN